ncbi:hypothetical protein MNBD_CHLOROFLEXI01-3145 [hydrothermal vent metagenome]|uniref:Uncharacterized protein n=1 Tax=hydrothermal vent metagenome TaxID=652676 RepID=A0A3B0V5B6_9ZZZZ
MSRNTKIVVGIIAGIVGVCCLIGIAAVLILPRMASNFAESIDDPVAAAEVANSIVDYDLPSGYEEQGAVNLFGFRMAFITGRNEQSVIMLAEFPATLAGDEEQMQQQMQEAFANQSGGQNVNLEFVGNEQITINGADATLATYEGSDNEGNRLRQIIGVFETKDGSPGMLMIVGGQDGWDEDGISRFIDSLE